MDLPGDKTITHYSYSSEEYHTFEVPAEIKELLASLRRADDTKSN